VLLVNCCCCIISSYVIDAVFGPYSGVMVDIIDLFIFHLSSYHFSEVGALDKLFVETDNSSKKSLAGYKWLTKQRTRRLPNFFLFLI
jgi:hypothetical protein